MLSSLSSLTSLAIIILTESAVVNAIGWGTYDPFYNIRFGRRKVKSETITSTVTRTITTSASSSPAKNWLEGLKQEASY